MPYCPALTPLPRWSARPSLLHLDQTTLAAAIAKPDRQAEALAAAGLAEPTGAVSTQAPPLRSRSTLVVLSD
jgi:hypothetical protein